MSYKIEVTVQHNGQFFEAIFERNDDQGIAVCRHIFGTEPSDQEIYQFILHNYQLLKFSSPQQFELVIKRKNFKRMMRDVKKEMDKQKSTIKESRSQELLREELERNKKVKKKISKQQKEKIAEKKFKLKQLKKKQKQRGH